jgi:hypothetical protein
MFGYSDNAPTSSNFMFPGLSLQNNIPGLN